MKKILFIVLFSGANWAVAQTARTQVEQRDYQCERGVYLPVTYINTSEGDAYAVLWVEGRQVAMVIAPSASGARYTSVDQAHGYSWHSKHDMGILSWQPHGQSGKEQDILRDCKAVP